MKLLGAICPKCEHPLNLSVADRMFGKYEMLEVLGVGGYGTVFKAQGLNNSLLFTLKLLRKADVSRADQVHLLRQIQSSRQMNHASVVAAHDFGQEGDYWYLISDYVEGLPLNEWVKRFNPAPYKSLHLCALIGDALQHIHDQQLIHRDLKPGNIIIDEQQHPHIIDFGLCTSKRDSHLMTIERYRAAREAIKKAKSGRKKFILGTPGYAAPEQLVGESLSAKPASDIYSLGVVLYELLANQKPANRLSRLMNRRNLVSRLNSYHLDPADTKKITQLCLSACSAKASKRPPSALAFATACRSISDPKT
ncbi:MAG: serine/threonine protein kinase [Rubripirellula sp.]